MSTEHRGDNLSELVDIMRRLLGPDGCPWDREQTLETLRPYVIEEAHEVADAIDRGDRVGPLVRFFAHVRPQRPDGLLAPSLIHISHPTTQAENS